MNPTPDFSPNTNQSQQNPRERVGRPMAPLASLIAAAIACTVCGLAVPFCANESVSLAVLAILFVCTVLLVRRPFGVAVPLVSTFLIVTTFGAVGGLGVGAVFLSQVVGTAALAWLMINSRLPYPFVLLPVLGAGLARLLGADLRLCLIGLAFLPAAILLTVAMRTKRTRSGAVCFAIGGFLISLVIALAVYLWQTHGSLSRDVIVGFFTSLRQGFADSLVNGRNELMQFALEDGSDAAKQLYGQLEQMGSDATLRYMADLFFSLLPAVVTVLFSIVAFEAQQMLIGIYMVTGRLGELPRESRAFRVSVTAAVLFTLSFFASFLVDINATVLWATVCNLMLILMPGLCVIGVLAFLPTYARSRGGVRVFLLLFAAFVTCCTGVGVLYVLSMFGAYHVIMTAIHRKMLQKLSEGNVGNGRDADQSNRIDGESNNDNDNDNDNDPNNDNDL